MTNKIRGFAMKYIPLLAMFFCAPLLANPGDVLSRVASYQECMRSYGQALKGAASPSEIADAASAKCERERIAVRQSYKALIVAQSQNAKHPVDVRAVRSLEVQMEESLDYLESVTRRQVIALAVGA